MKFGRIGMEGNSFFSYTLIFFLCQSIFMFHLILKIITEKICLRITPSP